METKEPAQLDIAACRESVVDTTTLEDYAVLAESREQEESSF